MPTERAPAGAAQIHTQARDQDQAKARAVADRPALTPIRPVEVLPSGAIRTARLLLRPLAEEDRTEFIRVLRASRQHLETFSPLHMPGESDDQVFDRQLSLTIDGETRGKACRRVVIDREGSIVGACNLNAIRRGLSWEADANCWLAAGAEGMGYATEGMVGLLRHAFADLPDGLGLHRIIAWMQTDNTRSERMIERLGFERGGAEKSFLHAGGQWKLHEKLVMTPEGFAARLAG